MPPRKKDNFLNPYSQMQDTKCIPTIKKNTPLNSKNHVPGHPNYEPQRLFQPMSYRSIKRNELPNINDSNSHQAERLALRIYENNSDDDTSRHPDNSACHFRATRPQPTIKQGF